MQYVGRAFDSVSKTLSSINPATLSGAIDIIVVENEEGELNCSPFHVRFGKFQLLRPSQKKVDFIINGKLTNLPMKLGDGGEAFFVFEASKDVEVPDNLITSPVLSAASSPSSSPPSSPRKNTIGSLQEPEFLDITQSTPELGRSEPITIHQTGSENQLRQVNTLPPLATSPKEVTLEKLQNISKRLTRVNIPTKIDQANVGLFLDMNGYKSNEKNTHDASDILKKLLSEEFGDDVDLSQFLKEDSDGNIKIIPKSDDSTPSIYTSDSLDPSVMSDSEDGTSFSLEQPPSLQSSTNYVKTLRLTSDQLKYLDLKYGENDLCFSVDKGRAFITSKLYLWKHDVPIVISDIDGTITKSDALGHVLTILGRDWTHPGVAKLFHDIQLNGYNIMYLTARSVGQADSTRSYLKNIDQDNVKLPPGPVILSPDRTMAALKREVILKKPEVFKMACLNDLKNLYGEQHLPFYAGFGNKITDALSYRSVGIPSSRIFTINPIGEVHMELLELAGYKSSYIFINELVDHFFPPVILGNSNFGENNETFTDVNYWREPLLDLSDLSDEEDIKLDISSPIIESSNNLVPNHQIMKEDDLDEDYNEEEDADYHDDGNDDDDDDYDDDDDGDDYSNRSEETAFDDVDDLDDLDAELLQEDGYEYDDDYDYDYDKGSEFNGEEDEVSLSSSKSGFLPSTHKDNSGNVSINNDYVKGIPSKVESFTKASELIQKLSLNESSATPTKRR